MIAGVETSLPRTGRQALFHQWGKDFQLWLYITVTLQLFRLLLLAVFHEQIGARAGAASILQVIATGLRYDISTAGTWTAPILLLGFTVIWFPLGRFLTALRHYVAVTYAVICILIFGTDLIFFATYGDQFNQIIFGIVHDDTTAILITIWKEYHPLLFLSIALPLIFTNLWLLKRWLAYTPAWLHSLATRPRPRRQGNVIGVAMFFVMVAFVRGGTLWGEPILLKHAFVVDDLFLNRSVINPFTALANALDNKLKLEKGIALERFWPNEDINGALRYELAQRGESHTPDKNLDQQLERVTRGHKGTKPKHIFLLLMESHSGWTVMPVYRFAGLSPEFSKLADEGIYFPNFLPSGDGTVGSMNALVTGLPDAGLNINYEATSAHAYPSGLAAMMKRLGYTTRFFYGGFLGWQRLDNFALNQGFDKVYGGGDMGVGIHTNEWGVDDKYLFDFVLQTVKSDEPSFNFILSTSNHPPYDLDLDALGYPLKNTLPEPLEATKKDTVKVLGHLWYADQQAGRFVRQAEQQLPDTLFAITGDHTARLQINFPGDSVEEQKAVPFILYGPRVLPKSGAMKSTAGSHLDIPATLVELAADKGFRYTTFGQNMLSKNSPSYGYGMGFIIGENFILNETRPSRKGEFEGAIVEDIDATENQIKIPRYGYSWKVLIGGDFIVNLDEVKDEGADIEQKMSNINSPHCGYSWKFLTGGNFTVCDGEIENKDESHDASEGVEQEIAFHCGYSWEFLSGGDFIVCSGGITDESEEEDEEEYEFFTAYALAGKKRPAEVPQINAEQLRFNALKALSWYRVKEGKELPDQ